MMSMMERIHAEATAPANATVLVQDGDWTIEELKRVKHTRLGGMISDAGPRFVSLIKHVCFPDGQVALKDSTLTVVRSVHKVVVYADDSSHCWRCNEPIPDGMQALWKFQNWKELEYGG